LYNTVVKACESADMAGSKHYMWSGCEQWRGNVGSSKGSLVRAKGMTILGKSEICTKHGPPTLAQKGDGDPL